MYPLSRKEAIRNYWCFAASASRPAHSSFASLFAAPIFSSFARCEINKQVFLLRKMNLIKCVLSTWIFWMGCGSASKKNKWHAHIHKIYRNIALIWTSSSALFILFRTYSLSISWFRRFFFDTIFNGKPIDACFYRKTIDYTCFLPNAPNKAKGNKAAHSLKAVRFISIKFSFVASLAISSKEVQKKNRE